MDVDYGTSHMGMPIHFRYAGGNFARMETIGKRIHQRRLALGIRRQADLAQLVDVDQSTISDIERGANTRPEILLRIADVLKTTPEWLVRGKDSLPQDAPSDWPLKTLSYAEFVSLPEQFHAAVENFAKSHVTSSQTPMRVGSVPQETVSTGEKSFVFVDHQLQEESNGPGHSDKDESAKPATRKSAGNR